MSTGGERTAGDRPERVAHALNRALRGLVAADARTYLLGEDIADPYGGAFKITTGLSDRFPDRVLSTPVSEGALLGVAGGLALAGNTAIAELMFGDFVGLAFDQILNFATKSVAMYGNRRPIRLVLRCPVGGNRGYGPTHSQSPQKHLLGIPNLDLYELSPFHDPGEVLGEILRPGRPAVLFEDKALYGAFRWQHGRVDDLVRYEFLDEGRNWAHAWAGERGPADVVLVTTGGLAPRALAAARELYSGDGLRVSVLVPSQLYPLDLEPVCDLLAEARGVCVADEGTAGHTWGSGVARLVYERTWGRLARPVAVVSSADSVIPAAPHLERQVLVQADTIRDALRRLAGSEPTAEAAILAAASGAARPRQAGHPITLPRLNSNDADYLLVGWLAENGAEVVAGAPLLEVETAKAVEELPAAHSGLLRQVHKAGERCQVGDVVGHLLPTGATDLDPAPTDIGGAPAGVGATATGAAGSGATGSGATGGGSAGFGSAGFGATAAGARLPTLAQRQVAESVSVSHRDIPAAYAVVRVEVHTALARAERLDADGAVGLPELLVRTVAALRSRFPVFFGARAADGAVTLPESAHVAVTVDAGNGLYLPVVRDADRRSIVDIADDLMDFRLRALRGSFRGEQLSGANIALSLNQESDIVLVQPIIPPGLVCILALAGVLREPYLDAGAVGERQVVNLGLSYDHRVVNGRDAVEFLHAVRDALRQDTTPATFSDCGPAEG